MFVCPKEAIIKKFGDLCIVSSCVLEWVHACLLLVQMYGAIDGGNKSGETEPGHRLMRDASFLRPHQHRAVSRFLHVFESAACFNYLHPIPSDA